ncbi:MAG: CDP-6-deoxy-delta-3,4-glucoseen reductase [Burkholderiaceae bacterium]|nr:CDP-6-deoxy-delta-3,4-glucoseen reductase [Burkholderiaceae bacterium]
MGFKIVLAPGGREFTAKPDETILDAALGQGVVLAYGCKNGACGSCKATVLAGDIEQGRHNASALTDEDRRAGRALLCCAYARSDLELAARTVQAVADVPVRKMPCRVSSIDRISPDVIVLRLQLPANERFQYLAGQYIELILRDGTRRPYSMAVAPGGADDGLVLHIRHLPGGKLTDALFGVVEPPVKPRDILRFEGPMGTFFFREDSERPIVLLASGTGFAPIKAIVEQAIAREVERPMTLYWGGRRPQDLYMISLAQEWSQSLPNLDFVPVVSDAQPADHWSGRSGLVHRAVMADFPDLAGHDVYACGAPAMVEAAKRDFIAERGLPSDRFFADAFTTTADIAASDESRASPP